MRLAFRALLVLLVLATPARAWNVRYSSGVPTYVSQAFYFPVWPGHVDYVTKPAPSARAASGVVLTFTVTGTGTLAERDPCGSTVPATVRLFLERQGDNLTQPYYRWWSNPGHVVLKPGTFTLRSSITPGAWSSVYGLKGNASAATQKAFWDATTHLQYVGFTFGGCFFGHGVYQRSGRERFIVNSYSIR